MLIRGVRQRKGVTAGAIAPQQPQLRSREGDPTRTESLDWTSTSKPVTMPFRPFGADVRSATALLDQRRHGHKALSAAYAQGQTRDPWVRPCIFGGKSTHHWAVDRRTRADRLADQLDPEYHRGARVDRRAGAPCAGTESVPQSGAPRYPGEARGAARLRLIAGPGGQTVSGTCGRASSFRSGDRGRRHGGPHRRQCAHDPGDRA